MKYIIADKGKAADVGFKTEDHRRKGNQILLNEKEVMNNGTLQGTLKQRVKALDGMTYTEKQVIIEINNGDWI